MGPINSTKYVQIFVYNLLKPDNLYSNFMTYTSPVCKMKSVVDWLIQTRHAEKEKLAGVGPVDKRPSTDKLHHLVRRRRKIIINCDM